MHACTYSAFFASGKSSAKKNKSFVHSLTIDSSAAATLDDETSPVILYNRHKLAYRRCYQDLLVRAFLSGDLENRVLH